MKKTVIITGGNKGIGLAISKVFANDGYVVFVGARENTRKSEREACTLGPPLDTVFWPDSLPAGIQNTASQRVVQPEEHDYIQYVQAKAKQGEQRQRGGEANERGDGPTTDSTATGTREVTPAGGPKQKRTKQRQKQNKTKKGGIH